MDKHHDGHIRILIEGKIHQPVWPPDWEAPEVTRPCVEILVDGRQVEHDQILIRQGAPGLKSDTYYFSHSVDALLLLPLKEVDMVEAKLLAP